MKTILICGQKGSGKTTASDILCEITGLKQVALADALKRACALTTSIPLIHFNDQEYKEKPFRFPIRFKKPHIDAIFTLFGYRVEEFSPYTEAIASRVVHTDVKNIREMLQFLGTEVLRNFDPDVHCKFLKNSKEFPAIISDCRFKNEVDFFKNDSVVVYIERDTGFSDSHVSETGVTALKELADVVIDNNGSLEDLRAKLMEIKI